MFKYLSPIILLISILLPVFRLQADVIITKDDMILNGKILEDKKNQYVKFANYHGNFTIKYNQIKEIHRTESFKGDIEILQQKGKSINADEIKNNYESGEIKLNELENVNTPSVDKSEDFILMFDLFYNKNLGKIGSVLPSSCGLSVSAEIPLDKNNILKKFYIYGIDSEIEYYYSEKDERYVKGFSGATGPLWRIPSTLFDYNFNFNISSVIGAGWYSVKNASEEVSAVKWNLALHAGPAFEVYSVVLSPQFRVEYIHDGFEPMYCMGISLGAGYKF